MTYKCREFYCTKKKKRKEKKMRSLVRPQCSYRGICRSQGFGIVTTTTEQDPYLLLDDEDLKTNKQQQQQCMTIAGCHRTEREAERERERERERENLIS